MFNVSQKQTQTNKISTGISDWKFKKRLEIDQMKLYSANN